MARPEHTEITINEDGTETHESWLLVRANIHSGMTHLFDSDIRHQHYVSVTVTRCTRRRDLHHDWHYEREVLLEWNMSEYQWGAFVSSFGRTGVPATLDYLQGQGRVSRPKFESRLDTSHKEVRDEARKSTEAIMAAHAAVKEGFERGAGKKEMRELHSRLDTAMGHFPSNMEFAAESLTEHAEKVTTKAKGDIEAMVLMAEGNSPNARLATGGPVLQIEPGE